MPQVLKDSLVVMVLQGASACCGVTYNLMALIRPVLLPELLDLGKPRLDIPSTYGGVGDPYELTVLVQCVMT